MAARIIQRGRGPEIEGTRITVYDVLDYRKHGWHGDRIAALFRLSSEEVQAAFDYIDAHRGEVMDNYRRILERHDAYEYSTDVKQKLSQSQGVAAARLAELRRNRMHEAEHAGDPG